MALYSAAESRHHWVRERGNHRAQADCHDPVPGSGAQVTVRRPGYFQGNPPATSQTPKNAKQPCFLGVFALRCALLKWCTNVQKWGAAGVNDTRLQSKRAEHLFAPSLDTTTGGFRQRCGNSSTSTIQTGLLWSPGCSQPIGKAAPMRDRWMGVLYVTATDVDSHTRLPEVVWFPMWQGL
jgi:hypothetical protein